VDIGVEFGGGVVEAARVLVRDGWVGLEKTLALRREENKTSDLQSLDK
jgi:hypothetical protein